MADYVVGCMQDGNLKVLREYIETLTSVNEYIYEDDENSLNLLHLAVGLNSNYRDEIIELLLNLRVDVNHPGKSDDVCDVRPLHLAAMWGYDVTVKLLLYHGADASLKDEKGFSPVDYASIYDNYLCISLLLRYGSLNSTATAWSAIMDSSLGDDEAADTTLDNDALYTTALDFGGDELRTNSSYPVNLPNDSGSSVGDDFFASQYEDPLDKINDDEIDLNMDNIRLRLELKRHGKNPGPITPSTKRLYAKLLARLIRDDKELVYSPRTTNKSKLNGYSFELNSIITGKFSTKQALELEREFLQISATKDYHGPKQFFNYILIDPRISKNLSEQALEASDSDTSRNNSSLSNTIDPKHNMGKINRKFNPSLFTKFIESIFYIGKGQKRRDFMHLYDALADRGSITKNKIERIRSIWEDGYGVVSLHIFHNITSKEALTREALMIESIGLENLTNLVRGTVQFKLIWNEHKRKLLGSLFLHRAYNQLLNEGERQLRREDLK